MVRMLALSQSMWKATFLTQNSNFQVIPYEWVGWGSLILCVSELNSLIPPHMWSVILVPLPHRWIHFSPSPPLPLVLASTILMVLALTPLRWWQAGLLQMTGIEDWLKSQSCPQQALKTGPGDIQGWDLLIKGTLKYPIVSNTSHKG